VSSTFDLIFFLNNLIVNLERVNELNKAFESTKNKKTVVYKYQ
jgi:hypothetical protein